MVPLVLPRVASGDPAAIREALARFGGLVWTLSRRGSVNESDAEDAAQEIFLDVWRSADRYDPRIASEATFVATIARRRLVDRRRRRFRRPTTESFGDTTPADVDGGVSPELGAEAQLARKALDTLRPEQRQVLMLTACEGLSHEEVATTTGMPLGTVKAHARRGLLRVREVLAEPGSTLPRMEVQR